MFETVVCRTSGATMSVSRSLRAHPGVSWPAVAPSFEEGKAARMREFRSDFDGAVAIATLGKRSMGKWRVKDLIGTIPPCADEGVA